LLIPGHDTTWSSGPELPLHILHKLNLGASHQSARRGRHP
jgi:hypothetical protein